MTKLDEALGLFPSVIKCGEQWSPVCQAVLEAAKAELAALRASAAPEEGMSEDAREELWEIFYGAFWKSMGEYSGKEPTTAGRAGFNAVMSALPSDSGKAAPDTWADDKLAAWASNWHCNDCATNPVDPTIYFRDMRMLKAFLTALSPSPSVGTPAQPSARREAEA